MKVGNISIQFNHRMGGYAKVEDVKYWRLYKYRVTTKTATLTQPHWGTRKFRKKNMTLLQTTNLNLTLDEVKLFATMCEPEPNVLWIAYPRKTTNVRVREEE